MLGLLVALQHRLHDKREMVMRTATPSPKNHKTSTPQDQLPRSLRLYGLVAIHPLTLSPPARSPPPSHPLALICTPDARPRPHRCTTAAPQRYYKTGLLPLFPLFLSFRPAPAQVCPTGTIKVFKPPRSLFKPPRSQDQPPKTLKNTQILPPSHPSSYPRSGTPHYCTSNGVQKNSET